MRKTLTLIPQFLPDRCCGTCQHAVWHAHDDGECHGGWWEYVDQRLPYLKPTVKARPFLLNKGCGSQCHKWKPA